MGELKVTGPQLKPLAELLIKFDTVGRIPTIWNSLYNGREHEICLHFAHRTYYERYFISGAGNVSRKDVQK